MTTTADPTASHAGVMALEVSNLDAGYGDVTVLHDVSLSIAPGEVMALLGANGVGKSTLLRTISGLIKPTSGRVHLNGRDVTSASPNRRAGIGLCEIPEGRGIFASLSVRENLSLLSPRKHDSAAMAQALEMFPILKLRMRQTAGSLSGGEQQMLAVSRAIVGKPALVLFDEVSLGLAPIIVDRIYEAVRATIVAGSSVLLVEQYVDRALSLAGSAVVLDRGRVTFRGSTAELRSIDLLETYMGSAGTTDQQ